MDRDHGDAVALPPKIVEIADRVFAYVQPDGSWWINNTGFVVGDKVVVSIDTCATEPGLARTSRVSRRSRDRRPASLSTRTIMATTRMATAYFPLPRSWDTNVVAS